MKVKIFREGVGNQFLDNLRKKCPMKKIYLRIWISVKYIVLQKRIRKLNKLYSENEMKISLIRQLISEEWRTNTIEESD